MEIKTARCARADALHPLLHTARRIVPCIIVCQISHKRTLILIQRLAFFLCSKSLAPQGFFHYVGCMERAFSLFFGCKWRLMLVSPYSALPVGCMIKRLLVVELVAVLYWMHPFFVLFLPLSAQLAQASGLRNAILSCASTECVVYLSYSV